MFNLLIVDDNQIVLDGLVKFVKWGDLGYRVIGVALSTDDAIKIIENEYVDVILSDIVMPGKTGFDLIKEARVINPIIKIVILSSFMEFKYAQEAVRQGAYDYLLKPVNFEELKNVFTSIRTILNDEIYERHKQSEYRRIMNGQFLNNLAKGYFVSTEEIYEKAFKIGFNISDGDLCAIKILLNGDVDAIHNTKEQSYSQLFERTWNKTQKFLSSYGKVYLFNNSLFEIGVLFYPDNNYKLDIILDELITELNNSEKNKVYLGVGNIFSDIKDLEKSFIQAGEVLENRGQESDSYLLHYRQISKVAKDGQVVRKSVDKPMGIAIENVLKYINEHYNEEITLQKLSEIVYVHPIYLSKLFKEKSGENFVDYLMKLRINHAKVLLKDLSYRVYDVCQMVGYESPKHFSKVFKEITGVTPKEYRNGF